MSNKYREVGVGLETGYELIRLIKNHVARTEVKGTVDSTGAFGGTFDPSVSNMKEPVLVSETDGVGTKLLVASEMDKYDTVDIDAVAMCVNDVLVQEAAPIFFPDYLVVGRNELKKIEQLVKGVADGRMQTECALIGEETAEMPDMYDVKRYDTAGSCVGAMDRCNLLDGQKIKEGNVLTGFPSTGVHSNGSSLIRKVLLKDAKLDLHKEHEKIGNQRLGDVLLIPTKIYVRVIKHLPGKVDTKGMSHIIGGSSHENVPRTLEEGQGVTTDTTVYPHKSIFDMVTKYGNIPMDEVCSVFNMGIGFMMAVDKKDVDTVQSLLKEIHEESYITGEVTNSGSVDVRW